MAKGQEIENYLTELTDKKFNHEDGTHAYSTMYFSSWGKVNGNGLKDEKTANKYDKAKLNQALITIAKAKYPNCTDSGYITFPSDEEEWEDVTDKKEDQNLLKKLVEEYGTDPIKAFNSYYSVNTWGGGFSTNTTIFIVGDYFIFLSSYRDS
ncbi:hypothetical protein ABK040_007001 [Willaertia magna]